MAVAIIPYRDRELQLARLLPRLVQRINVERVVVCEPVDDGEFNRGWVKNVGFRVAQAAPAQTVYFYDVDLLPGPRLDRLPNAAPYQVVHLYGHPHCLGGIVGMRARDFEAAGGFVNDRQAWGGEDRYLRQACEAAGMRLPARPTCLRFEDDGFVREMDAVGHPMDGQTGVTLFRQDLASGRKQPAPRRTAATAKGHLASTTFDIVDRLRHPDLPAVEVVKVRRAPPLPENFAKV